ncbi:hypothetical protein EW026_g7421 [Hermanssonia centrifuga]|uniref:Uncharacterized protein n=1 Tax=Hermanssonia centrifuga TaxID=98765 RepID=A0A4S4K9M8_9APHY|nr:hypothetical protein EW026_g7421 [Hermanssonia centrifuga]
MAMAITDQQKSSSEDNLPSAKKVIRDSMLADREAATVERKRQEAAAVERQHIEAAVAAVKHVKVETTATVEEGPSNAEPEVISLLSAHQDSETDDGGKVVDSVITETALTKKKCVLRKTLLTKSAPRKAKRHVITVKGTKGKCMVLGSVTVVQPTGSKGCVEHTSDIQVGSEVLATAEPSSEGCVNEVPAVIEDAQLVEPSTSGHVTEAEQVKLPASTQPTQSEVPSIVGPVTEADKAEEVSGPHQAVAPSGGPVAEADKGEIPGSPSSASSAGNLTTIEYPPRTKLDLRVVVWSECKALIVIEKKKNVPTTFRFIDLKKTSELVGAKENLKLKIWSDNRAEWVSRSCDEVMTMGQGHFLLLARREEVDRIDRDQWLQEVQRLQNGLRALEVATE